MHQKSTNPLVPHIIRLPICLQLYMGDKHLFILFKLVYVSYSSGLSIPNNKNVKQRKVVPCL